MNDAQELTLMTAVRDALDRKITEKKKMIMETTVADDGAKSFLTELGLVEVVIMSPSIIFNDDALMQFASDHDAEYGGIEIVRQVRSTFRKLFAINGQDVIFEPTGEVVPFARVKVGNRFLRTKLTDDAKNLAYELVSDKQLWMITDGAS